MFPVVVLSNISIMRNRRSLTWGWPEVLYMAPIVQIWNKWAWPELFSLSLITCISSEKEWVKGSFLLTKSSQWSDLCCDT
jgi:hypothetical protein